MSTNCTADPEEPTQTLELHQRALRQFLASFIYDPHLLDDTLSDVNVCLLECWDRYDSRRPFGRWARAIAWRIGQKNLRQQARRLLMEPEQVERMVASLDELDENDVVDSRKKALRGCMDKLPPRHRRLLQFRYFDGCKYPEISGLVGTSVSTLYVVINRCQARLRECIQRKVEKI